MKKKKKGILFSLNLIRIKQQSTMVKGKERATCQSRKTYIINNSNAFRHNQAFLNDT